MANSRARSFLAVFSTFLLLVTHSYGSTVWSNVAPDTNWFNPADWSSGVPNATTDATIQSGVNQPLIIGAASVQNLTLNASASLSR